LQPTGIVEMLNAHDGIGPFGLSVILGC